MVVLIARDDVEDHSPELLLHRRHRQLELADRQQRLLVGVGSGLVEIKMRQCAQRLFNNPNLALPAVGSEVTMSFVPEAVKVL